MGGQTRQEAMPPLSRWRRSGWSLRGGVGRPGIGRVAKLILVLAIPTAAAAQDRLPIATGESDRAAFQVQGLPLGGFRLYPSLRATLGYDDNVRLGGGRRGGDGIVTLAPALALRSQWSNHALNAAAFLRDHRYVNRGALDNDEYGASGDGRLDVLRDLTVTASAGAAHLVENRGSPGDLVVLDRFVEYNMANAAIGVTQRFNRIAITAQGSGTNFRYDDAGTRANPIEQTFRDRNVRTATLRAAYQYSAATSLFLTGGPTRIRYRAIAAGDPDRASNGWSVLGGVRFELSRLLSGEVAIGYIRQSFRDARYSSFSGLNYDADIRYAPTALTTFRLTASRRLTDSALRQVGGVLTSRVAVSAEHELLRNLILAANAGYDRYNYRGIGQDNRRFDLGLGARYKISRAFSTALSLNRIDQTAGGSLGRRFVSNRVSLSLLAER